MHCVTLCLLRPPSPYAATALETFNQEWRITTGTDQQDCGFRQLAHRIDYGNQSSEAPTEAPATLAARLHTLIPRSASRPS
jgi:hypothetical protein